MGKNNHDISHCVPKTLDKSHCNDPPSNYFIPNARILYVEDDEPTAAMVKRLLNSYNLETDVCNSSEKAKLLLKEQKYDLILLDVVLPGIHGNDFSNELAAFLNYPPPPVIFISGFALSIMDTDFSRHPWEKGLIKKPFLYSDLIKAVFKALGLDQDKISIQYKPNSLVNIGECSNEIERSLKACQEEDSSLHSQSLFSILDLVEERKNNKEEIKEAERKDKLSDTYKEGDFVNLNQLSLTASSPYVASILSSLSHELGSSLFVINGLISSLKDRIEGKTPLLANEPEALAEALQKAAVPMSDLISKLVHLVRSGFGAGVREYPKENIRIGDVIFLIDFLSREVLTHSGYEVSTLSTAEEVTVIGQLGEITKALLAVLDEFRKKTMEYSEKKMRFFSTLADDEVSFGIEVAVPELSAWGSLNHESKLLHYARKMALKNDLEFKVSIQKGWESVRFSKKMA